jgi:hypothetical protein
MSSRRHNRPYLRAAIKDRATPVDVLREVLDVAVDVQRGPDERGGL